MRDKDNRNGELSMFFVSRGLLNSTESFGGVSAMKKYFCFVVVEHSFHKYVVTCFFMASTGHAPLGTNLTEFLTVLHLKAKVPSL